MNQPSSFDAFFMEKALCEAEKAGRAGDVPIGCVIVLGDRIIARAGNRVKRDHDPTSHAELLILRKVARKLKNERLNDTILYTTLEPCAMCAGAIVLARVPRLVYGAKDPKAGACGSLIKIIPHQKLNHRPQVTPGILADRCGRLLKDFFRQRRQQPQST